MPPKKQQNAWTELGISAAEYKKAQVDAKELLKEQENLVKSLQNRYKSLNTTAQEQCKLEARLNGNLLERQLITAKLKEIKKENRDYILKSVSHEILNSLLTEETLDLWKATCPL